MIEPALVLAHRIIESVVAEEARNALFPIKVIREGQGDSGTFG